MKIEEKIKSMLKVMSEGIYEKERLCKARAEAKFTWIMPSRSQRCIYMNEIARHITAKDYEHARIDRRGY